MTVSELIHKLKLLDQSLPVCVTGSQEWTGVLTEIETHSAGCDGLPEGTNAVYLNKVEEYKDSRERFEKVKQ